MGMQQGLGHGCTSATGVRSGAVHCRTQERHCAAPTTRRQGPPPERSVLQVVLPLGKRAWRCCAASPEVQPELGFPEGVPAPQPEDPLGPGTGRCWSQHLVLLPPACTPGCETPAFPTPSQPPFPEAQPRRAQVWPTVMGEASYAGKASTGRLRCPLPQVTQVVGWAGTSRPEAFHYPSCHSTTQAPTKTSQGQVRGSAYSCRSHQSHLVLDPSQVVPRREG